MTSRNQPINKIIRLHMERIYSDALDRSIQFHNLVIYVCCSFLYVYGSKLGMPIKTTISAWPFYNYLAKMIFFFKYYEHWQTKPHGLL